MDKAEDKKLILAAEMLKIAANEFGNHGCNDLDASLLRDWSPEEKKNLAKEYGIYNGDNEDCEWYHIQDFALMGFLANYLPKAAEKIRREALEQLAKELYGFKAGQENIPPTIVAYSLICRSLALEEAAEECEKKLNKITGSGLPDSGASYVQKKTVKLCTKSIRNLKGKSGGSNE